MRSFTFNDVKEHSWGTVIATSQLDLPFIQDQRGLFFMNTFLAGSLGALFGGVHWFIALRRKQSVNAG